MTFLNNGKAKKAAWILATVMFLSVLLGAGMPALAATYYKGTAKTKVNLREAPSSKAPKAGALEKNDEVILVANVKKGNTVNGYTADVAFFKLSTGEYVAAQYIAAGEAVESDAVDGGSSTDDSSVPDESGEDGEALEADTGDGDDSVSEIDLETGEESTTTDTVSGTDSDDLEATDDLDDNIDDSSDESVPEEEESADEASSSGGGSNSAQGTVTADALKVRVNPSMSATVIKKLSKGEKITITQSIRDGSSYKNTKVSGNWYKLDSGGFVAATFVKVSGTVSSSSGSGSSTTSYKVGTATADTKMYSKPLELSTDKGTLKKGESMRVSSSHKDGSTVSGMKVSGNWYRLSNGYYVKAGSIKLSTKTETSGSSLASDTTLKAGDTAKTTAKLNMRGGPGTSYSKKSSLAKGTSVTIEEIVASGSSYSGKNVKGTWAKLSNGGFVSVGYLEFVSSGGSSDDVDDSSVPEEESQEDLDAALPEE